MCVPTKADNHSIQGDPESLCTHSLNEHTFRPSGNHIFIAVDASELNKEKSAALALGLQN